MKKVCLLPGFLMLWAMCLGQSVPQKLSQAVQQLEKDEQLEAGSLALYIVDQLTGKLVFERNGSTGMAPASTQKLFTAAAALDILGPGYRYGTTINLYEKSGGSGIIELAGSGDPTLGSPRFAATRREKLLADWAKSIRAAGGTTRWTTVFTHDMPHDNLLSIPEGYIWQDIGNYYGAGSSLLNWNENQYDMILGTGATGTASTIKMISPLQDQVIFRNTVTAGKAASGDNAYIFAAPFSKEAYVKGTVPPNQSSFTISGSMPDPAYTAGTELAVALRKYGAIVDSSILSSRMIEPLKVMGEDARLLSTFRHLSPGLDTLVYWFLRKSINLYGEALVKTMALENKKGYDTERGLELLKNFWIGKGIAATHLGMRDGSGLSPLNRVTAKALVQVLQYSLGRTWYPAFFYALPEYNGMKIKSGSIEGARAFAGYHTSGQGKKYIFAIMVNNFNGSASAVVRKMYKVLDCLK